MISHYKLRGCATRHSYPLEMVLGSTIL